MDIVVITGQVPATGASIEYDHWADGIYPDDIVYTTSRYDLQAVEEAIRLKETKGEGRVTLIAAGPRHVEPVLRAYLSLGADAAIHICDPSLKDSDAYSLSLILSQAIKKTGYDLVLCGAETMDDSGGTAFLGPYIAEMLGLPQVSRTTKIELEAGGQGLIVQRKMERGEREVLRCSFPCLLSVEAGTSPPRYPTLPDSLSGIRKEIKPESLSSLGLQGAEVGQAGSRVKVIKFLPRSRRVKKGLVVDSKLSAADRMKMVMSGGLMPKSTSKTLLTGETDKLAAEMVSILVRQGIIRQAADRDGK